MYKSVRINNSLRNRFQLSWLLNYDNMMIINGTLDDAQNGPKH